MKLYKKSKKLMDAGDHFKKWGNTCEAVRAGK